MLAGSGLGTVADVPAGTRGNVSVAVSASSALWAVVHGRNTETRGAKAEAPDGRLALGPAMLLN